MDANQLGRRNLSKEAHDLLLGRRYNRTKRAKAGAPEGNQNAGKQLDQNEPIVSTNTAAAKLATEHGVSEATVKRAMVGARMAKLKNGEVGNGRVASPIGGPTSETRTRNEAAEMLKVEAH